MNVEQWEIRHCEHSKSAISFIAYGIANGVIVSGITVNAAKQMRNIKKMILSQQRFESLSQTFS